MSSSGRNGHPKHANKYAWKPNAGHKKNETEVGGKLRPFFQITGVCGRCKDQIEWKRKYGKYKPLVEPAKCQRCGKRAVRQAYHNLCSGKFISLLNVTFLSCAKDLDVCAKCSCCVDRIIGRDISEVEAERKLLEESIKNARERDRRTLLRAMGNGKDGVRGKSLRSAETMKETTGEASNDEPVEQGSDKDDETEFAELSDEG
ncbi:hypothetical protein AMTRI_Chr05g64470 [Amborella trichopoda]